MHGPQAFQSDIHQNTHATTAPLARHHDATMHMALSTINMVDVDMTVLSAPASPSRVGKIIFPEYVYTNTKGYWSSSLKVFSPVLLFLPVSVLMRTLVKPLLHYRIPSRPLTMKYLKLPMKLLNTVFLIKLDLILDIRLIYV